MQIDVKFLVLTLVILLTNLYFFVIKKQDFKSLSPRRKIAVVISWIAGFVGLLEAFFPP